jgi:uncharacterized iron-regulated protein
VNRPLSLVLALPLLLGAPLAASQAAEVPPGAAEVGSDLPYPPPQSPQPDEIAHVPTGLRVSFDGMMEMVSGARLVFVGETHDNFQAHRVQLEIIRDLERRFPGRVAIGMEMFRQPQQETLDRWSRGRLTELEFLQATQWQKSWGVDFRHYRAILDFARDRHIDLIALNPSADLQDEVRRRGLDSLPDEVRSQLPEIGDPDPYEHAVMKAIYGAHLPTEGAFEAFFRVQLLWEESMAERVVDYLHSERGQGKIIVVLAGAGHVEYGFGVPKKVLRRLPLPYAIIAPTEIEIPPEKQMPGVELPAIPLLPSDFVWWIRYEDLAADTPRLGVGIDDSNGALAVQSVAGGSPAERAGLRVGDEITAFAGHAVPDVTSLVYWVGQQEKGTSAIVTIRRAGAPLDVQVEFRP